MKQIWKLALNDLRLVARDRPAFFWILAMPIGMMWIFGSIGGGGASGPPTISLDVINHDTSWVSRVFVDELRADTVRMRELTSDESAVAEDRVRTLVIPEGFSEGVLTGHPQTLQMVKEPETSESYGIAAQVHVTRAIVRTLGRLVEMGDEGSMSRLEVDRAEQRFRDLSLRPRLVSLAVSNAGQGQPVPSGRAQSVPGMLTFTVLMMTLIYGAVFLTLEKSSGMLRRQATLPLSRRSLFLGKLLGKLLMAAIQILLLILAGRYIFDISWGNSIPALSLMLVAYATAVAGMATLLGAVLRSPAQASSVGWIGAMVMAAIGGCWWPAEVMPRWMWTAAHAVPTAWAMQGFHALITFGGGLEAVIVPSLVLFGFGALFAALGVRYLRFES